jgi:hypothetical protein
MQHFWWWASSNRWVCVRAAGDVSTAIREQRAAPRQHHRVCAECGLLRTLLQEQGLQHHLYVRH